MSSRPHSDIGSRPTCLILGSTGYLGSSLAHLPLGKRLRLVSSPRGGSRSTPAWDALDVDSVSRLIDDAKPDIVINFVGVGLAGSLKGSGSDPNGAQHQLEAINADFPSELCRILARSRREIRLLHVASATEPWLGAGDGTAYSQTKAVGSQRVLEALQFGDVVGSVAVVHNVYGPGQPATRFVSWCLNSVLRRTPVSINFPNRIRDFCYVKDVRDVLLDWLEEPSAPALFEIGTGVGTSLYDVASQIAQRFEVEPSDFIRPSQYPGHDPNPVRVARITPGGLGHCKTNLSEGLRGTIAC